ncbi:hypothetical protein PCANB_000266 [Pneumocystis canis]|nr:hypothetical protein PCANB_000266 [Pneumocystis canis]
MVEKTLKRSKNLKKNDWIDQLKDLKNPTFVESHDPEDLIDESYDLDSFSDSNDIYTGREHYLTVKKRNIGEDDIILDDEKYMGKKTSLKDLYQNDDISENKTDQEYEDFSNDDEISHLMDRNNDDLSLHVDSNAPDDEIDEEAEKKRREELKSFIENEQKDLVREITKVNKLEIEKGKHIQAQIKIYNNLLDARIRLQKALVAMNSLALNYKIDELDGNKLLKDDAENESISLINFLTDIRKILIEMEEINVDDSILKRKEDSSGNSTDFFYNDILNLDKQILTWQNETLLKWSDRVKATSVLSFNKFNSLHQNILDLIQENMMNKDKLLEKTYIDRSEKKEPKNKERFDDTDFYQTLLLDLINRRMVDSGNTREMRWSILRQKKQKNNVDTKASKGRRLRYHVHDKLQNFMTPNPINLWTEKQTDKLFSSLFGQIYLNNST